MVRSTGRRVVRLREQLLPKTGAAKSHPHNVSADGIASSV
jgi:hypothetical protein